MAKTTQVVTPIENIIAGLANKDYGTAMNTWVDSGGTIGSPQTDPYAGMNARQIADKYLSGIGQTQDQWAQNYIGNAKDLEGNSTAYGMNYANGNLYSTNTSHDDEFDPGMGVMAALTAMFGGVAAGAFGGGGFAGSGLVDGLGSAAYEGAGGLSAGLGGSDAAWGVNQGAGMDLGDWQDWGDFGGGTGGGGSGFQMPSAVPETTQQLTDWGMKEIGDGRWAMPGEVAGSLYAPLVEKLGPTVAKSLLQRLMSGEGSASDYASILGRLAATGLGVYGANRQAGQLGTLSQQYAGYGAPYRSMLAQSYADPAGFLANSPDIKAAVGQGTDALARSLSTQGNPTGSGAALQQLQNYATQGLYGQLGNERNRLANFGGLSNFNAAAPGLAGQSIQAQGGALNAIGSGISSITNPPTTLEQALNAMNSNNFKLNNGTGL